MMPMKAPRICSCGTKVAHGLMCACLIKRRAEIDRRRPNATQRGYNSKWARESKTFLALPGNQSCACGCGRIANVVDHIVPHRGDMRLFWDRTNWQPLNSHCHNSAKQASERKQRVIA
jgi:5-methylcytosine-specific restriction endonuclease McrA